MQNLCRFALIGGDMRYQYLAQELINDGYNVCVYGFNKKEVLIPESCMCQSLDEAIDCSDIVLLPLPVTTDGITLNAPYSDNPIPIESVLSQLTPGKIVLVGKISDSLKAFAQEKGFQIIDYFDREELSVLNAIPTAEGAIAIAMQEMQSTLHSSKCLITGYGRIGKILVHHLKSAGAFVTVAVRKKSDFAWLKAFSINSVDINELLHLNLDYDVIFNTVPAKIFNHNVLQKLRRDTLLIDLASKPGGVDMDWASRFGIKVIWALSLPGKVAPKTAGKIIKDTIMNIIEERKL